MTRDKKGKFAPGGVSYWRGKKMSDEHRKKLSEAKLRRYADKTRHPSWRGDDVGYFGLHGWIQSVKGRPTTCEGCDKKGLVGNKIHWANKSHLYKREVSDWVRLCVPCHSKYDRGFKQTRFKI